MNKNVIIRVSYWSMPGLKPWKGRISRKPLVLTSTDLVMAMVCKHYNITLAEMKSKRRFGHIVLARQVATFLLYKYVIRTLNGVGRIFGQDHTTALHSISNINDLMDTDSTIRSEVEQLEYIIITQGDGLETISAVA